MTPALLDVRGEYSVVLYADDDLVVQCYLETTADGEVLTSNAAAGSAGPAPAPTEVTTVSNGVTTWAHSPRGGGAVAVAFGRAGKDVTGLEVTLTDGQTVTATVEGGWWMYGLPASSPAAIALTDARHADVAIRQSG